MLDWWKRIFSRNRLSPVSKALEIEPNTIESELRNAIAAIDRVHTDGQLPRLPVKAADLTDSYGQFRNIRGGQAVEIVISLWNPHCELTTVHEIGHFLDFKGLDHALLWASANSASLAPWRTAVKASQAVQTLGQLHRTASRTLPVTLWDGSVVEYFVDKPYVEYLLEAEELWARSYSQFIAAQSRDTTLLRQLAQERSRPMSGIYYPKHWEDTDFLPILTEMETLFRGLRWIP